MTDRGIVLGFAGWTLLFLAVVSLSVALVPMLAEPDFGEGYFAGLAERTLTAPYQRFLLAGWLAVLPHYAMSARLDVVIYDGFGVWAQGLFTSLGFLGTIVGVSIAVAGLPTAMQSQDPTKLIEGLSTAFDTTFLGLGAAVTLLVLRRIGGT